jgi:4-amino-4-deoxy-L-arabinose transferase-like glycosyltransferase
VTVAAQVGATVGRTGPRGWRIWRSPADQPAWSRPALLAVAAIAALSYSWGTAEQQPEIYYAAAVRSMAGSWHNFFFAAFDPDATMSVDKLPGALWLQALSVRAFGVHIWALNLPQVIEGTLTVLVLFRAVRRLGGVPAAMIAAVVYACTPATVALNRGNVSDSLLILLLVCAVDAACAALLNGRIRSLVVAGVWVGLAFQAKMLQAWLVLPVLVSLTVLAMPQPLRRRIGGSLALVGVTAAVSLSWLLVVSAVPHHDRPYVDGSRHDSLFEQVFEYNGFSRADSSATASGTTGAFAEAVRKATLDAGSRPDRTIAGAGGRAIGWLLPAAAGALVLALLRTRRRPRSDPLRIAALLWSGLLVIDLAAFTLVNTINAYYLAALTPAIAALVGIGLTRADPLAGSPRLSAPRLGLTTAAAAVVGYGCWLLSPAPLGVRVGAAAVAATLIILGGSVLTWATPAALAAVLVAPTVASVATIAEHGGPFTTPYQAAATRAVTQHGVAASIAAARRADAAIARTNAGARYPAAAYTSLLAAPLIFASGIEILPIGGFTGTTPAPTLRQLTTDISQGRLRTVLIVPTSDTRADWVRAHCTPLPSAAAAVVRTYYCAQ